MINGTAVSFNQTATISLSFEVNACIDFCNCMALIFNNNILVVMAGPKATSSMVLNCM